MQLERTRAHLLSQLDAINSAESAMAFQRALAHELSAADTAASPDNRWHRHLLRLMGDALARQLLSPHTLRELARDQRPVSALIDQGDDFEFVLDVAERLAHDGVAPIVADLTHLIGVGDLIAVTPDGISIIECKNRQMPDGWMLRGRQWRQRQRQAEAASYLANGYVRGADGQSRIALEIDEPKPRHEELRECVQQARDSTTGSAVAQFGERDYLIASWDRGLEPKDAIPWIDPRGWRFPAFGSATATENPGPFIANPYALPLPTDTRHALTEGDLLLLRLTDLDLLACERIAGNVHSSVEVYKQGGSHQLRATFDGKPLGLSQRFIEQILFDFWAVADIRSMLMAMLEAAQQLGNDPAEDSTAAAAPEIPTLNSFAYRDSDGTATPILVSRLSDFTNLGVSIPYEDLEAIAADTDQSDIRAMIERQGHQLVMRLDNTEPPGSADRRP